MNTPQYAAGEFIVSQESVYMLIVAVIPGDPSLYAISHIKQNDHLHWITEHEIADRGYVKGVPHFAAFQQLQVGDTIAMGDNSYMKVLARVDDAVLLSQPPDEAASFILDMARSMKEQGIEAAMPDGAQEQLQNAASMNKAYRRAGHWHDVRTIALFNWRIVRDDH